MKIKTITLQKHREYGPKGVLARIEIDLIDDPMPVEESIKSAGKVLDDFILHETKKENEELDIEIKKQVKAYKHLEATIKADTMKFNELQHKIACAQRELNKKKTT